MNEDTDMAANNFINGGGSQPFGNQHPDDSLPRAPSNNLPGSGDEAAMEAYIQGKQTGEGDPLGGSDPNANRMVRHGVRQARRQVGRAAKSTKPLKGY